MPDALQLNGKKFFYEEIAAYSFRQRIPINGQQEFVVHTSGSTGPPKDIILTRQQLEASARRTLTFFNLQPGDRALVCLNAEAISGMMMLVRGLVGDLDLTVIEPIANPLAFSKPEQPFDFISLVPYQLQTIISETPAKKLVLDFAKVILLGGAALPPGLEEEIQHIKPPVFLSYGMTETASHIALRQINGNNPDPFYRVLPGIRISQDERGCLTVCGDVTLDQIVVTNDLVRLVNAEAFEWLGRADNTINTGGYKVQLEKVEVELARALAEIKRGCRSFVTVVPDERLGQRLVAVLECSPLDAETEEGLRFELGQVLNKFELPKAFYTTRKFLSTPSGKIDKIGTLEKVLA